MYKITQPELETLNTEKQNPHNRIVAQNTESWNTTHPSTTKPMLTEDKINVELNKENHDWKEDYITIP